MSFSSERRVAKSTFSTCRLQNRVNTSNNSGYDEIWVLSKPRSIRWNGYSRMKEDISSAGISLRAADKVSGPISM